MKNPFLTLVVLLILGGIVNSLWYGFSKKQENLELLEKSYQDYVKGEQAQSLGEREDAFNQSLLYYTELETQYQPIYGNGKLYYNIGNSYFQLGEYPFAALYYYRAKKLMPREDFVAVNLSMTLDKLGISEKQEESVFQKLFFYHFLFSIPEKLQLFFIISLVAVLSSSLYIWTRFRFFKNTGVVFGFFAVLLLISFGFSHYIAPIEAVLVKSSALYRDAGYQYAKVQEAPVLSGSKLEVLDVIQKGEWLKVKTQTGDLGYVPQEALRII
jgi:tetratricopeptide (TPR) repeat protein